MASSNKLLKEGDVFKNSAVFKPVPQHPGRLEAYLQPFLLLMPEKGEGLQNRCFTSQKQSAGASATQRDPIQGLKSITPQRKTNCRGKVSLEGIVLCLLLSQIALSSLQHKLLSHILIILKSAVANISCSCLAQSSTLIPCSDQHLWASSIQVLFARNNSQNKNCSDIPTSC